MSTISIPGIDKPTQTIGLVDGTAGTVAKVNSRNALFATEVHDSGMDFYTAVGLNMLSPNIRRVTALGNNPDVDSASVPEDIWSGGGLYPFLTAATNLEIVSSSVNDTAAGTGARTVTIFGLDASYVEISSTVTLNGTTAVAVPIQYFRINSILVITAGSLEVNDGAITVRDAGAGATRGLIPQNVSISRQAIFTVPAGHTLSIHSILGSLNRISGISKNITIGFSFRSSIGVRRLTLEFSLSNTVPYRHDGIPGIVLSEKTDVSLRATFSDTNDTDITAAFLGILFKNTVLTG